MNKKILAAIIAVLVAVIAYLGYDLAEQKQVNKDMRELAVLEKQEMEDEYEHFAVQYGEMKTRINDDSIVAQLTREQQRTQELLEERKKIGSMKTGQAAATPAFALDAKYIIHTVGPAWWDGQHGEKEAVRECYENSLKLAKELGKEKIIVVTVSGRGDKDCAAIARYRGEDIHE